MKDTTYRRVRKNRINHQAKKNALECLAESYAIMSETDMNATQALISAYVVSGRGNLNVTKVKVER